jgi:adenylate kinase
MNIILIGPQGSGKGTQAKLISKEYNIPHISTGDIFRETAKTNTKLGKKLKNLIDNGILVPDNVTNDVIKERLSKDDIKNGFVLDGYPRNLNQAEFLNSIIKIDHVFEIAVSDKESIKRLSSRRQCRKCNLIYGAVNPPKNDNKCDNCGEELYQRDDDKEDAIKKRLKTYHKQTEPLINYYKKKGLLVRINGEQSIEKIFDEIKKWFKRIF